MPHPIWQLTAFDVTGNSIGTITRMPDGPVTIEGTPDAFACCIPDLHQLPAFFTDPDAIAREAYQAYIQYLPRPDVCMSWDALKADPAQAAYVARWLAVGRAATRTPMAN